MGSQILSLTQLTSPPPSCTLSSVSPLPSCSPPPLSTGPESGEMTDMGLLKRILMELLPNHMELLLKVMELQPHLMELLLRLVLTSPPSSSPPGPPRPLPPLPHLCHPPSVRRKREFIDDSEVSVNAVERMMDMYQAVIESEECLERVACDVGAMASDAGLDTSLSSMASIMVPNKYSKYMKQFATAKNCHKRGSGDGEQQDGGKEEKGKELHDWLTSARLFSPC